MDNQLFREKSLKHISSPEELHHYLRVTGPRLWMILTAVVALLIGFIVYASTVTMENTMPIKVSVEKVEIPEEERAEGGPSEYSFVYSSLPIVQLDRIRTGMKLRIGNEMGHISWISTSEGTDNLILGIEMEHSLLSQKEGEYDALLILESTTPISFLWN